MSEAENKDAAVQTAVVTESAPVVPSEPASESTAPAATTEIKADPIAAVKSAPAAKHAPRKLDKFAERRAELKRQKRVAHRRRIAASNTPG